MEDTQKLKILVCEEELRVLSRLESWIEAIGHRVVVIDDGITAFEMFKKEQPDIVLISQELKNMGGIELIKKIRKVEPTQAIILMLSNNYKDIFTRAIDLQVDKYLNKPVEAKPLFAIIESLSQEKIWYQEFNSQKRTLQDYKDAIDLTFSVSRHDCKGNIIYVNNLFCTTTKITHEEAMQGVINPLQNSNEDMSKVWSSLEKEFFYKDRQVFKLENKSERIIDITAVALVDEKEEVSEYLVFLDDVTDIIQAARKIKNQELDNRLAKLNHAKELNNVKDSFLTIFTHELKTPLNSIINFSEYIMKHLAKEEFQKKDRLIDQVKEINNSGYFMLDMITNLMEAIKLKDGNIKLQIEKMNLNTSLELIVNKYLDKEVTITIKNDTDKEYYFYSDELRFKQIFTNVISNAVKYASSEVEIIVKADDKKFTIEVIDNGKGFSDISNVFDLFEQSDANSMTREASGTGVGLFIVKQLCDRMSYNIELGKSLTLHGASIVIEGKRDIRA